MASVSRLRALLISAFNTRGLPNGEQDLFEELMAHRAQLVNPFEVGPRNPQEQRELDSGKIVIHGRPTAVNADFVRQASFLSQQLDCSERYVAGLVQDVADQNPNIPREQQIETVILEYHRRRRETADCLRFVLEAAEQAEYNDAPPLCQRIEMFVRQQLIPPSTRSGAGLSLPMRVFQEIHSVGNTLEKAQNTRQSAKSDTIAPSQGNTAALGADILTARCESLKYERRTLAISLFRLSRMGCLSSKDLPKMVDWLSQKPRHPMAFYVLAAILTAFDIVDPKSNGGLSRKELLADGTLIAFMQRKLDVSTEWPEPGLKATILLKWTLFLTTIRHSDPSLENRDGFRADELETQIWNAVQGDCFTYLARTLMLWRKKNDYPSTSYASSVVVLTEQDAQMELPAEEFKPALLEACEALVRSLITLASSELRKVKQRQEDFLLAGARSDRARMHHASLGHQSVRFAQAAEPDKTASRNDLAMLFSFIGMLYKLLPPERALPFWGSVAVTRGQRSSYSEHVEASARKLPAFLQWAIWSTQARDYDMSTALFDMIAGLAHGQQCSELAYNFLARGGNDVAPGTSVRSSGTVSWNSIFDLLHSWVKDPSPAPRASPAPPQAVGFQSSGFPASQSWQSQPQHTPTHQLQLTQQDVLLAQSFLRVLSVVVTHSITVRLTIVNHNTFRVIPTLVSVIPLGVPLELKGAIFETLTSFCEPGAGGHGLLICRSVWECMEKLEVINVRAATGPGHALSIGRGVEVELDEVEAVHRLYPSTIPFLKLLSTLIYTPKRIQLRDRVADSEPMNTIPENLGGKDRIPGIAPYASFVVDHVFARIPARDYIRPTDRWQMNDLCLCFIERCLASYDLESVVTTVDELVPGRDAVLQLVVHPGFDMMKRILTDSPLRASVLSYLVDGLDGFDKGLADQEPFYRTTIVRVLRIIHRVLEIQDIFLDVFIPSLSEVTSLPAWIGAVPPASYFIRLDQALSYSPDFLPAVAAYIAYPAYPELMLLSVRILTVLASNPSLTQLALLIDRSSESVRILNGFLSILGTQTLEDVEAAESAADQGTGAGAPDVDEPSDLLTQAIRLAVLDLFVQNTHSGRTFPNIAHLLLLGSVSVDAQIQDPHALGARRTCVHAILDLINEGVPRLNDRERRSPQTGEPLFVTLPAFAERCYRIIYQLCQHSRTSESTMRYLRTHEDFFARHLAAIPFKVPSVAQEPFIEVLYSDGSRVVTTVAAMASFVKLRSWILDLVALDLHVLTNKKHHKSVSELLNLMFGNEEEHYEPEEENWETQVFKPFHEVGQSHLRMIELVQSLDFDWSDSLAVQPQELELLRELNLQSCLRVDESGCQVVDRIALVSLLTLAKRTLHQQGRIATEAHVRALDAETAYILESCAIENHRRTISHATASGYEAWKRLLDMALTKCFDRLPLDRRESMLFDLLHVLPHSLRSPNVQEPTAVLLSESLLSTITKLRENRRHQATLQTGSEADTGALPAERLIVLLRSVQECITENQRSELVRGNLYASLINYLHLVLHAEAPEAGDDENAARLSATLSLPAGREASPFGESMALTSIVSAPAPQSGIPSLIAASLTILKPVMDRLITIVARDAVDGSEVWKTVAFMLLDSLVRLSRWEKVSSPIKALARQGFLSGFVHGLKEADARLQGVLKPDPDDLNPLYVYEAKMSLLIRLVQTRQGAERLLESQAITILAGCDFLDARPEADQTFLDQDSFLPSAIQRYHQLLMPALQLVNALRISLGSQHTTSANHTLQFLSGHSDTAILLLKNEVEELSLPVMEEIRLLVSLCSGVVSSVPRTDLLSNSGYGSIHGAIASLAAKCLGDPHWTERVQPQTDAELADAGIPSLEYGQESRFRVSVHEKDQLLRSAVISYLGTASDFAEADFTLVLSPVVNIPRQAERSARFLATVPTVGDAIEALNELCGDLSNALKRIVDISAELASKDHIRVEHIEDIIHISDPSILDSLDIPQKRSLMSRELGQWRVRTKRRAQTVLGSLEMLLLLLWRHLVFYCRGLHVNNPDLKGAVAHAMRFASAPDGDTLKAEAQRKLVPLLRALQNLEMSEEALGPDWRSYDSYRTIMVGRLADAVGLEEEPEAGMSTP